MTSKTFGWEVKDLGCDHAQYFPGFGTAFSQFQHSALGAGSSAREAGEDALEQFWMTADKTRITVAEMEALEAHIHGLSEEEDAHKGCEEEGHEECEWSHYVGIRWFYGR